MDANRGTKPLQYHQKRVAVTKEITFDAAHRLERYQGKCSNIHGHTYRLEVTVSGYPDAIGLVIDFYELKKMLDALVVGRLDHQYLNEVLPMMNATADNLVVWIWEQCEAYLQEHGYPQQGCRLEEIRLFETPTSWATLRREWMYINE